MCINPTIERPKTYKVTIEETIVEDFSVPADSPEEAQSLAVKLYREGKIVLTNAQVHVRRIAVKGENGETLVDFEEF